MMLKARNQALLDATIFEPFGLLVVRNELSFNLLVLQVFLQNAMDRVLDSFFDLLIGDNLQVFLQNAKDGECSRFL